jgi:multicomponent Na+:H+ antiporter subunit G
LIIDIIVAVLVITGCLTFLVGTLGIIRVPDAFARLHPSTMCDTLGAGSIFLAMLIYSRSVPDVMRLLLIGGFLCISSAVCDHVIGRSVFMNGSDNTSRHSTSGSLLHQGKRE